MYNLFSTYLNLLILIVLTIGLLVFVIPYFLFNTYWGYRLLFRYYSLQNERNINQWQNQIKQWAKQGNLPDGIDGLSVAQTIWTLIFKLIVGNKWDLIEKLEQVEPDSSLDSEDLFNMLDSVRLVAKIAHPKTRSLEELKYMCDSIREKEYLKQNYLLPSRCKITQEQ